MKTHPHTLNDVLVQNVVAQPGGFSGWHSHPGYGIVAVRSGIVTLYDVDDPACTAQYVGAGEVFTEEPGHVHFARNDGNVAYEASAMFVMPVGVPSRTDVASRGIVLSRRVAAFEERDCWRDPCAECATTAGG